jgi:nitroreductase
MFKIKSICTIVIVFVLISSLSFAGNKFDLEKWQFSNRKAEIIEYKGQQALRLERESGAGIAFLKDVEFVNGTIELDIAAIPRFTGLVFRVNPDQPDVYESIYFRPQNSRHASPVMQKRTVQYISHPRNTWYYLRGKYPGKYEAAVDIAPDEWFHVKVEVKDLEAKVYVNNSSTPCLVIGDLKHGIAKGSVGVWCGNGSAGTFANFKYKAKKTRGKTAPRVTYNAGQQFLFDTFKNRRSVRKFKSTPVPPEHLMKILDMARSAPTSGNQQPWKFLVIQDRDKLGQLKDKCVEYGMLRAKMRGITGEAELEKTREKIVQRYTDYLSAPVYVVVLVDKNSKYPGYNTYDGSLAGGYLMLAARSLGYGTVFSQDTVPYGFIKEVFGIPDNFERICFTPIGVPDQWPESPAKNPLRDFLVFEQFVRGVNY